MATGHSKHIWIANKTRGTIPRLPFADIAKEIVGATYELSVAFVTPTEARRIARTYKHKDYPANVLSFRLHEKSGELIMCPSTAKKEAPDFDRTYREHMLALFIHGLLHLDGHTHGGTMERQEIRLIRKYS